MTEDWRDSAACAGVDGELFFPEPRGGRTGWEAKAICARCPVRAECLDYALSLPIEHVWGIWAGTTDADRRALRRERKAS